MKNYLPFIFALLTALCWGLYGPTLGKARLVDMDHSPFKPYFGIGLAYLVIAILGGAIGMWYKGDHFSFTGAGTIWGVAAGTLGAFGALGLTLAMFSGGARIPHAVMPVVFGGAVTVAALYPIISSGGALRARPLMWIGIAGMAVCIVIVAYTTPHPAPAPPPTEAEATSGESSGLPKTAGQQAQP